MDWNHIQNITNIMALKTYYLYEEKGLSLLDKQTDKSVTDNIINDLYTHSLSLIVPAIELNEGHLELADILWRTLLLYLETDRFGVLWKDEKNKIVKGLSIVYFDVIAEYINNNANLFVTKSVELTYRQTFQDRIKMKSNDKIKDEKYG